jgi:hypothetical protein
MVAKILPHFVHEQRSAMPINLRSLERRDVIAPTVTAPFALASAAGAFVLPAAKLAQHHPVLLI